MNQQNLTIWYLHPYAGGPGLGNSARPYHLASAWIEQGANSTVFCSSWHHLMTSPKQRQEIELIGTVPYCFIPARIYQGNGLGRLLHMADFCLGLWRNRKHYQQQFGCPDAIVVSSPHPYSVVPAWFIARIYKSKLIFEVRDIWPLSLIELAGVSKWHPLVIVTGWIERFAYRWSDATVSLLPGAKSHMVSRGLKPYRFHYVPNGANLAQPNSIKPELDQQSHPVIEFTQNLLEQGCFVVVYPGAMGPPNNMKPLIEAANQIANTGNLRIQFILMGQGVDVPELQKMVEAFGLSNVHFFAQADRSIALQLMAIASAGYVSVRRLSIYKHGISFNKLFEYMQQCLPVVFAAEVPGNPIEVSGAGVVTAPDQPDLIAQAIIQLSELPLEQRQIIGKSGLEFVKRFHDYHVLAAQYLSIIQKLKTHD